MKPVNTARDTPPPPNFHWTFVLLLGILTFGLFLDVWAIVQAIWVRKFHPSSRALPLYIWGLVTSLLVGGLEGMKADVTLQVLVLLGSALVSTFAAFSVRDSLATYITSVTKEPAYLSGLMTIFFGSIYLQYHMDRVRSYQRRAALSGAR
jgi:hypothetical protein